jgi:uncharacterized protein with HEPN domain
MDLKTKKWLQDILQAAREIEQYTAGLGFDDFQSNGMAQAAVERKFEIIGEALSRISRSHPALLRRVSDYERIIGFRNIISHGYDIVDVEVVWDAVRNYLPVVIRQVEELLAG